MRLNGAHCPVCLGEGPDFTIDAEDRGVPISLQLDFTCSKCRRRWKWSVKPRDEFPRYKLIERVLTAEDKRGDEIS